jgi:hypothetical protein
MYDEGMTTSQISHEEYAAHARTLTDEALSAAIGASLAAHARTYSASFYLPNTVTGALASHAATQLETRLAALRAVATERGL